MAKYNEILSDGQIQKVFTSLQPLNADYITFEDFFFGYCIVNFKQRAMQSFRSGSILIDEQGDLVSIINVGSKKCDGLESIKKGWEGSSLMNLTRVYDKDGIPSKYILYVVVLNTEGYDKQRCEDHKNGIYNTVTNKNVGCIYNYMMNNLHAVAWPNDLLLVSYNDKDGKYKCGVIDEKIDGWDRGKWMISANFDRIEYKENGVYTFDQEDLKKGEGCLYSPMEKGYEEIENENGYKIFGCIIRSQHQLIRNGKYAGDCFSKILPRDKESYLNYFFLTDAAMAGEGEVTRGHRDSKISKTQLLVTSKVQTLSFDMPKFVDAEDRPLSISPMCEGMTFENAYLTHYDYISTLMEHKTLIVQEDVFTNMLKEDYANQESPMYAKIDEDYRKKYGDSIENKYFRDLILFSRDDIYNVLSDEHILHIKEYIRNKYNDEEEIFIEARFQGKVCAIDVVSFDLFDENPSHMIIIDRCGNIIDKGFSKVKIINNNMILYSKFEREVIENEDEPKYFREYCKTKEQGIINSNGDEIFKGELGDIERAKECGNYIILERSQYSDLEKDKINFYIDYCIEKLCDKESIECPNCGGTAYWSSTEDSFVCKKCANSVENFKEEWELSPIELLACENFSEALTSDKVSDGQFIQDNPEEIAIREEYLQDEHIQEEYSESDFPLYTMNDEELEDMQKRDECINNTVYAVFSKRENKIIIPFQRCQVTINPAGMPSGIYLANQFDKTVTFCGHKYEKEIKPADWAFNPYFGDVLVFKGQVLLSVLDTFRSGELVGQSLYIAFKAHFPILIKLLNTGCIFISTDALRQLNQVFGESRSCQIEKLIIARDRKFCFGLKDVTVDTLNIRRPGKAAYYGKSNKLIYGDMLVPIIQDSLYADSTLIEIFHTHPAYLISLIKNMNLNVSESILDEIDKFSMYYVQLEEAVMGNIEEQNKEDERIYNEMKQSFEEEERRYYENDGYRSAFEDDPEAEWNID